MGTNQQISVFSSFYFFISLFDFSDGVHSSSEMQDLKDEAEMPMEELLERYGGAAHVKGVAALKKGANKKLQSPMLHAKQISKAGIESKNGDDDVKKSLDSELQNGHCEISSSSEVKSNGDIKSENKDTEVSTSSSISGVSSSKQSEQDPCSSSQDGAGGRS